MTHDSTPPQSHLRPPRFPKPPKPRRSSADAPDDLDRQVARLFKPEPDARPFLLGGADREAVRRMAAGIAGRIPEGSGPVAVVSEDRAVVAASVLAALARNCPLILPYATTRAAVAEIHARSPLRAAVSDQPESLPAAIPVVTVEPFPPDESPPPAPARIDLDLESISFFTGGSTGRPEIWTKTPRNLLAEAQYHSRELAVGPDDRILSTVVPYHIYGFLFTVLMPLLGSAAVLPGRPDFPEEIRGAITRSGATILVSVPVHYRIIGDTPLPDNRLRLAISSAGRLDPEDGKAFYRATGRHVTEVYGSTETGGIATRRRTAGEIGFRPFSGIDWTLDGDRLWVRSPFLPPGLPRNDEGYFGTGDRAEPEAAGGFVLIGRADGIIKVGGNRVDLEVVRSRLEAIDGVDEAVVIARSGGGGRETEIRAAVRGSIDHDTLIAAISRMDPSHHRPRNVRIVDRIPVTPAGKVDRRAVDQWFEEGPRGAG